jgi:hypothetical protein
VVDYRGGEGGELEGRRKLMPEFEVEFKSLFSEENPNPIQRTILSIPNNSSIPKVLYDMFGKEFKIISVNLVSQEEAL